MSIQVKLVRPAFAVATAPGARSRYLGATPFGGAGRAVEVYLWSTFGGVL